LREKLLWAISALLIIYIILPWVLTRYIGLGVFRKGKVRREIAFTFDDGPDPLYTPQVLDLLQKHQVKATFFVVGCKAEQYPEIIKRIHAEGHQIGIHNYEHLPSWILAPWSVKRKQLDRSADVIEMLTGLRPVYYRPPWGTLSLWDILLKKNYKLVFWSEFAYDWLSEVGKTTLSKRMMKCVKEGAIVLLHDSGTTYGADSDAPHYMIQSLDSVLSEVTRQGMHGVRVDEMMHYHLRAKPVRLIISRPKKILVSIWMLWERAFLKVFQVKVIDPNDPLIKVRVREYDGKHPIPLENGAQIVKGDPVAEIHLDNQTLYNLSMQAPNDVHLAIQIIHHMREMLPKINLLMQNDPHFKKAKAVYGISLINRGAERLGFSIIELPKGAFSFFTKRYLQLLLLVLHPEGTKRLKHKTNLLIPKMIVISKDKLNRLYL